MRLKKFECLDPCCYRENPCAFCSHIHHIQEIGEPRTYQNYAEYLEGKLWKNISSFVQDCYENRCANEDCLGLTNTLNIHHQFYSAWGTESLYDLICVCNDCHKEIHARIREGKNLSDPTCLAIKDERKSGLSGIPKTTSADGKSKSLFRSREHLIYKNFPKPSGSYFISKVMRSIAIDYRGVETKETKLLDLAVNAIPHSVVNAELHQSISLDGNFTVRFSYAPGWYVRGTCYGPEAEILRNYVSKAVAGDESDRIVAFNLAGYRVFPMVPDGRGGYIPKSVYENQGVLSNMSMKILELDVIRESRRIEQVISMPNATKNQSAWV